jgi:hypothetical protein
MIKTALQIHQKILVELMTYIYRLLLITRGRWLVVRTSSNSANLARTFVSS